MKRVIFLVAALLLGMNAYAANGDLIVNGNATVAGTTTMNGNATVAGTTTMNGNATVTGTTTMNANATVNGNLNINGSGHGIVFPDGTTQTTASTGTPPSGDLIVNGKVGIGKPSPIEKLHVAGVIRSENVDGYYMNIYSYNNGNMGYGLAQFNDAAHSGYDMLFNNWSNAGYEGGFTFGNTHDPITTWVKMRITKTGNVGIGTADPGSYKLYVAGTAFSSGGWQGSDARFKKNLEPISQPVSKVLSLNGVSYEWKTDEFRDKGLPEGRHYGVIAQEIEKVLPEVVNTGPNGEKAVAYTEIIPVLIEAIKEQQKQIDELKKIIAGKN